MPSKSTPSTRNSHHEKNSRSIGRFARQQALHEDDRVFACNLCEKNFKRKDTLTRHVLTHTRGPSLLEKKARACRGCAASKLRCSGECPCLRCKNKSIECVFPPSKDRNADDDDNDNDDTLTRLTPLPDTNAMEDSPPIDQSMAHTTSTPNHSESPSRPSNPPRTSSSNDDQVHESGLERVNTLNSNHSHHQIIADHPSANSFTSHPLPPSDLTRQRTHSSGQFVPPYPSYPRNPSDAISPDYAITWTPSHTTAQTPSFIANLIDQQRDDYVASHRDSHSSHVTRPGFARNRSERRLGPRHLEYGWNFACVPSVAYEPSPESHFADFEYEAMHRAFVTLCVDQNSITTPFSTSDFPSRDVFDHLIHIFSKHVHPSLPFVHWPTFHPDHESRWVLLLAMASISCWYLEGQDAEDFAESLLEFLRRVMLFQDLNNGWRSFTNCRHAQIILLLLLSALASKHETVELWNDRWAGELYSLVRSIIQSYAQGLNSLSKDPQVNEWLLWAEDEQTIRTALIVWQISLFQSMQKLDADRSAATLASIASLRMPCSDAVFEAPDATEWQKIEANSRCVTLFEGLQTLYMEGKLASGMSDLNQTLLIYGVIARTRETQDYVEQPFFSWEPCTPGENGYTNGINQSTWAPSVPVYARWRKLGLDCLNILHWQMSAAPGLPVGFEPTKLLHLHLAQIFVSAPINHLFGLARMVQFTRSLAWDSSPSAEVEMRQIVQRWAISDQQSARQAAFHAGGVFWHIRRYATDTFYEPLAVLAATLTLWALSVFSPWPRSTAAQMQSPTESHDAHTRGIILIDRPTDNELVQEFLHHGTEMQVVMQGVSDLWSPSAPHHILREGRKLLSDLGPWYGEAERSITLLDGLIGVQTKEI